MTREDAIRLYSELMKDLREAACTGLDFSPGDPLARRALLALEAVIDSLPNAPLSHPSPETTCSAFRRLAYGWLEVVDTNLGDVLDERKLAQSEAYKQCAKELLNLVADTWPYAAGQGREAYPAPACSQSDSTKGTR
jgi:hypothetical protein